MSEYQDNTRYRLKYLQRLEAEEKERNRYTISTDALIHLWVFMVFLFFILLIATRG